MELLLLKIVRPKTEEILKSQQIPMTWQQALKPIRMKVNPLNRIEIIITEHQVHSLLLQQHQIFQLFQIYLPIIKRQHQKTLSKVR